MKHKTSSAWFSSAGLTFLVTVFILLSNGFTELDFVWIGIGVVQLCLGFINLYREKKESKD